MPEKDKKPPADPTAMPKSKDEPSTVDVTVGADKDSMAIAETQNRQVGVDDTKDNRDKLHDAMKDQGETVELDVPADNRAGQVVPQRLADDPDKGSGSTLGKATRAGMPGTPADDDDVMNDGGVHTVTVNGQTYTWRDGEEGSVPAEAVEVYRRALEANTP